MNAPLPSVGDVRDAADRIRPYVHRTPVFRSRTIDRRVDAEVFLKAENLQKVGAFKARGATNAILRLGEEARGAGVATHSSGNHGQALAYASSIIGVPATIVMPRHAPAVKVDAVRSYGAEIVFCEQADREATLDEVVARTGQHVVHPFDDADVVAGQGTAALELTDDITDLDLIVAPIGGGGLLSGTTLVASDAGIDVVGAEPDVVDDAYRSLRDGVRYGPTGELSVGDGLLTGIGSIAFAILSEAGVTIVTVSERSIMDAMRFVVERTKLVIEPSAATVFAAMFSRPDVFRAKRVGAIVSGGNVELDRLSASDDG
ncbi:MAG: threonine/serine dehydratase [Acidimicrobiia bacterium]|nr:threonine/serine dehydratase [Acidimicrobiia bacterium]